MSLLMGTTYFILIDAATVRAPARCRQRRATDCTNGGTDGAGAARAALGGGKPASAYRQQARRRQAAAHRAFQGGRIVASRVIARQRQAGDAAGVGGAGQS